MGDSSMAGMAGMSGMDAPVTIPPGAMYTVADVHFMQGMIAHHAQAIAMSKIAYKNDASKRLTFLATKIDQSQRAEIALMQGWLHDHNHASRRCHSDGKDLFATPMSGQETNVNVFANDVDVVQTAEIAAMRAMLADL